LFVAVAFEVLGTSTLKATEGFTRPIPSAITLISYAAAFYVLSLTLNTIPVGIAYAIWAGFGVVLITLIGWIVYKQQLDAAAVIGIVLVLAGVLTVNLFSKTVMH
jgi:small multidrug resistance pump